MDSVFIEGLEVDTVIGVYDWEREIRQCLRLDLTLRWDIRPAAGGDDLAQALDYAAVCQSIQTFASEGSVSHYAVLIAVQKVGFEGPDHRWMAVTGKY